MRSVFLPDSLAAVELHHSWQHLQMFGVLGAWAVLGLVLAPIILRRMARRESGSAVAARRERAMSRVGG
jgi:ABC-2 type transport system permease protein